MIVFNPSEDILSLDNGIEPLGSAIAFGPDLQPSVKRALLAFAVDCERTINRANLDCDDRIAQLDDVSRHLRTATYESLVICPSGVVLRRPGMPSLLLTEEHATDMLRSVRVARGVLRH